jgi:hypothetical protein
MANNVRHSPFARGKGRMSKKAANYHINLTRDSTMFAVSAAAMNNPYDNQLNKMRVADSMRANSVPCYSFEEKKRLISQSCHQSTHTASTQQRWWSGNPGMRARRYSANKDSTISKLLLASSASAGLLQVCF